MKASTFTVQATQTSTAPVRIVSTLSTEDVLKGIPEGERWIWRNRDAMQSFARGKEDVRAGRVVDLGSFVHYIDLDTDD